MTLLLENVPRLFIFVIYLGCIQILFTCLKRYVRTMDNFKILPDDKKDYVLKNIFKSFILFISIPRNTHMLYLFITEGRQETWEVIAAGWLYSACDIMGLINVKLPTTTLIHHLIVCVFTIIATLMNHEAFSFFTPIVLYGALCTYTFSVNLFLGIRHLYPESKSTYHLCRISFWIYATIVPIIILTCFYCYYLMFHVCDNITIIAMMVLIGMLWRDDFILLGWLRNYYTSTKFYQKNLKQTTISEIPQE
jgi:hypothetical protein